MHVTPSDSMASVACAKFPNQLGRSFFTCAFIAMVGLATSCKCPLVSTGARIDHSSDTRLENAILAFVSADGRISYVVRGHELDRMRLRKDGPAIATHTNSIQQPRMLVYDSSKELYKKLLTVGIVQGDKLTFYGTCESIQNQYPGCVDIQDPGPGVTWRKDMYSYFHHCVPDSGTTNVCTGTWQQVGTSYFYPTERQCELNVGVIRSSAIMDYFCESR